MWGLITGMGAVTSVGRDVATACASIRAGISRPRPMIELTSIDEETQDPVPLIAHPVAGFAEGFVGYGAWVRLATPALAELLAGLGPLPQGFWRDACLLLLTRYLEEDKAELGRNLVARRLAAEYHIELPDDRIEIVPLGGASLPVALVDAPEVRWSDGIGKILVVAVDSYFEAEVIEQLTIENRLRTPDNPVGMALGQAAVALLFEEERAARRRGAKPLATVSAVTTDVEENDCYTEGENTGVGLSRCIANALDVSKLRSFTGEVVNDLNGEEWRAKEWGGVSHRLADRLVGCRLHCPAVSVGDVGAASGPLGVCLALHMSRRGASTQPWLIASSSEEGDVGCMIVQPQKAT
jgi:3-oxoacyl-[acyl-carrier-protein] synthase I